MNLRDAIKKILEEWNTESKKSFPKNQLAAFVRDDFFNIVKKVCSKSKGDLQFKSSAGAGNWANIPWLSILDSKITTTTQDGIYPVYLFRSDGTGAYLSLNQGIRNPHKILGKKASENRAKDIGQFLHVEIESLQSWDRNSLDLRAITPLGRSYEKTNIGFKFYNINSLPSNEILESDLKDLLNIYHDVSKLWPRFSDYKKFKDHTLVNNNPLKDKLKLNTNQDLIPKPFLLLAGISGTGKTRFVRKQAEMSAKRYSLSDGENYCLVPVRPDWHEPSDLLGYVSRIKGKQYVSTLFLSFLIKAWEEIFDKGGSLNSIKEETCPFWLCLDEMNLAPVEQYFADYLSILETREWKDEKYSSHPIISENLELVMESLGGSREDPVWKAFFENNGIPLPPNLIVAGTVNMDETTHGFSRKVIDRALTLDFQEFFPNKFDEFFEPKTRHKMLSFSVYSQITSADELEEIKGDEGGGKSIDFLKGINNILKSTPFELAFRALNELLLSVKCFAPKDEKYLVAVWDDFLMQKVLPRIEGDAEKLQFTGEEESGILQKMKEFIQESFRTILGMTEPYSDIRRPDLLNETIDGSEAGFCNCKSLEKIDWMQKRLEQNQFTSFWA